MITEDEPFEIEFELQNDGDDSLETLRRAVAVRGRLDGTRGRDEPGAALWTDAYELREPRRY